MGRSFRPTATLYVSRARSPEGQVRSGQVRSDQGSHRKDGRRRPRVRYRLVSGEGSQLEVAASFFLDAEQGQVNLFMDGPSFPSRYGDYQAYGTSGVSGNAAVVDCGSEP